MRSKQFRFLVFTCRDPKSDFRLPLVDALRHDFETYYIWLRRHPVVSGPGADDAAVEMSLLAFLRFMRRFRRDDQINVYFNSTNTYFPGMTALLYGMTPAGVWCLDMHDDLRYHNTGMARLRETLIIYLLRCLSHVTLHAAPALQELFPDSHHVGNASNIRPIAKQEATDNDVLIIASFDERFDFDLITGFGWTVPNNPVSPAWMDRPNDKVTTLELAAITARNSNIQYHGPYTMADLPGILSRYRISIAPYRMNTKLTRYIDPLRFYHCLNAGLEVISTDIPQARYMADWVHVVSNVTACAETLAMIRAGRSAKQPSYSPITWEQRADRLIEILRGLPRTISLDRIRRKETGGR